MVCRGGSRRRIREFQPNLTNLDETGRRHFFYHSPSSEYPVRDVNNEQGHGYKTEPYIELGPDDRGAENYCRKCLPENIREFLKSSEKYLFLFTTCRNEGLKEHCGNVYIVGYIKKVCAEFRHRRFYAVIGPVKLYPFRDAYQLGASASDNNPRQMKKKCDLLLTRRILKHFKGKKNILTQCRKELKRLKEGLPEKIRREQLKSACRLA